MGAASLSRVRHYDAKYEEKRLHSILIAAQWRDRVVCGTSQHEMRWPLVRYLTRRTIVERIADLSYRMANNPLGAGSHID